jgi:hypothetical protein
MLVNTRHYQRLCCLRYEHRNQIMLIRISNTAGHIDEHVHFAADFIFVNRAP